MSSEMDAGLDGDELEALHGLLSAASMTCALAIRSGSPRAANIWAVGSELFVGPAGDGPPERLIRCTGPARGDLVRDTLERLEPSGVLGLHWWAGGSEGSLVVECADGAFRVAVDGAEPIAGGRADAWAALASALTPPLNSVEGSDG